MNSEIIHVSKLVPVTVLRNKQNDLNAVSANKNPVKEQPVGIEFSKEILKTQPVTLNAEAKEASLDSVKSAAATGNSILQATNRNLEFQVDDSTKKIVVKIVDSKTGDVVRQIPSEEMLDFIKRMQQLEGDNQGIMLQDKA